jgi:hypothetical protein
MESHWFYYFGCSGKILGMLWQHDLWVKAGAIVCNWRFDEHERFNGIDRIEHWFRTQSIDSEVFTMMVIMALVTTL